MPRSSCILKVQSSTMSFVRSLHQLRLWQDENLPYRRTEKDTCLSMRQCNGGTGHINKTDWNNINNTRGGL